MSASLKEKRLGLIKFNKDGDLMKIAEYRRSDDIIVEFQDEYRTKVHVAYREFDEGSIKNPYHPSVYGVGMLGNKCPTTTNGKLTKEFHMWREMLQRSYYDLYKKLNPTYQDASCCKEWLLFENFYEWLHQQENFNEWLIGNRWAVDKDILVKGNKIYSPETSCLVPDYINKLFLKSDASRGNFPIGVTHDKKRGGFVARCCNNGERIYLGYFQTAEKAFQTYKKYKESLIKQIAQKEYDKGNIIKKCYDAMMNYKVEITD